MTTSSNGTDRSVLDVMSAHRSIRAYEAEPLDDETIATAVRAAQMAATGSNVQAYSLLHITDDANRQELVQLTGGQPYVAGAGAFFVICADSRRHRIICEEQGGSYHAGLEAFLVAVIDASLFAQNLVLAFESMGLGTCYIGGLRNDLAAVDALLGFPEGVYPLFGLCAGVPAEDPDTKPRLPLEAILFKDAYPPDEAMADLIARYDKTMGDYYLERTGKQREWSSPIAQKFVEIRRGYLAGYYQGKGAGLD